MRGIARLTARQGAAPEQPETRRHPDGITFGRRFRT